MALLPLARRFGWFLAVVLLAGLAGATLVRLAPGFGTDERMLDSRLSNGSIQAIAQERQVGAHVAAYYLAYLRGLLHGDLGTSISLGRPVRGLLAERAGTSFRSAGGGLGLAWACALALAGLLEWFRLRRWAADASAAVETLLVIPGALVAIGCFYLGGQPALAIAAILFPRLFRYTQSLVRQAAAAPHVLAAEALGQTRWRILTCHLAMPLLPELLSLAGVSVSMAAGATILVEALCDSRESVSWSGRLRWDGTFPSSSISPS